MAKYSEEIVSRICEMWEDGSYTIKDICNTTGVSETTFFRWKEEKRDFWESLKKAEERRYKNLRNLALGGLRKLLQGYEYDEVVKELKNVDGQDKLIETKRITKRVSPNPTSVIFTLKNQDSDNFKDRHEVDVTTKGESLNYNSMSDDELIAIINEADGAKGESGTGKKRISNKGVSKEKTS